MKDRSVELFQRSVFDGFSFFFVLYQIYVDSHLIITFFKNTGIRNHNINETELCNDFIKCILHLFLLRDISFDKNYIWIRVTALKRLSHIFRIGQIQNRNILEKKEKMSQNVAIFSQSIIKTQTLP